MESKNETKQEMNLDQMETVSGGINIKIETVRTCPVCGQEYSRIKDPNHEWKCKYGQPGSIKSDL